MCGHFVLGGTHGVLQKLDLWQPMIEQAAAVPTGLGVWSEAGWIVPQHGTGVPPAISLRRRKLDPLLRSIAGATPGVDLLLGQRVTELVEDASGAVRGVIATDERGGQTELRAQLVVGADGNRSTVASLAGLAENRAPNQRFLFWTYYEGATMNGPGDGQVWQLDPDIAVCMRVDDGLTQVGIFPSKNRLPEFTTDRLAAFDRIARRLPDGPSLAGARRVSNLVGTLDYPCVRRHPTPRPGLALIGDAATTSDPVPAVGCGWAFRSAAWLAAATSDALVDRRNLGPAMRTYRRAHRFIEKWDDFGRRSALASPPSRLERAVRSAAIRDPYLAERLAMFAMRTAEPSVLLNPKVAARALIGSRKRPAPAEPARNASAQRTA